MTTTVNSRQSVPGSMPTPLSDSEVMDLINTSPSRIHSASIRAAARDWLEKMHHAHHPGMARYIDRSDNRGKFPNQVVTFSGTEGDGARLGSLEYCLKSYSCGQRLLVPWGTLSGWRCSLQSLIALDQEQWRGSVIWLDLDDMVPSQHNLVDMEEIVRSLVYEPDESGKPVKRRQNGVEVVVNLGNTATWTSVYLSCDQAYFIERTDPAGLLRETNLSSFLRNPYAVDGGRVPEDPGAHEYRSRWIKREHHRWNPYPDCSDAKVSLDEVDAPAPACSEQTGATNDAPDEGDFEKERRFRNHRLSRNWVILASMLLSNGL